MISIPSLKSVLAPLAKEGTDWTKFSGTTRCLSKPSTANLLSISSISSPDGVNLEGGRREGGRRDGKDDGRKR